LESQGSRASAADRPLLLLLAADCVYALTLLPGKNKEGMSSLFVCAWARRFARSVRCVGASSHFCSFLVRLSPTRLSSTPKPSIPTTIHDHYPCRQQGGVRVLLGATTSQILPARLRRSSFCCILRVQKNNKVFVVRRCAQLTTCRTNEGTFGITKFPSPQASKQASTRKATTKEKAKPLVLVLGGLHRIEPSP
jgi:hypothetical protein